MISILYYLGIRRAELVNIEYGHIEKISDSEIYLHVFGKGDKERIIPFPPPRLRLTRRTTASGRSTQPRKSSSI